MAIIYVNIAELEKSKTANIIPSGNTNEEKAKEVIKFYEKGNHVCLYGTIITSYDEIIKEIEKQINYKKMSDYKYWEMKTNRKYIVFMLNDNMAISFDYFLFRENKIDEYYKYTAYNDKKLKFQIIYQKNCLVKLTKRNMIKDVILLESCNAKEIS